MAGRLLSFKDYLGGADNVQVIEMFPRNQKTFQYNFGGDDVSGYTFTADYQTLVVDTVAYDRVTGDINFADSSITGYFGTATTINPATYIDDSSASSGFVNFTIPENRYTGPITPDARNNVVLTVVSFQWETDDAFITQKEMHRWAVVERWEPGVSPGDPTLQSTFVKLGVGAIATFSDNASTDVSRVEGKYTVEGLPSSSSEGTGQSFVIDVDGSGNTTVEIVARGTKFAATDTIVVYDTDLGNGGASDITITVSTIA